MEHRIAHDFNYAGRARRWAVQIAHSTGVENRELVEATALLHDMRKARRKRDNVIMFLHLVLERNEVIVEVLEKSFWPNKVLRMPGRKI